MSFMNPDLAGKRLELLREIAPRVKRVAILTNPSNQMHVAYTREAKAAGHHLGIELKFFPANSAAELDALLPKVSAWGAQGLWMIDDPSLYPSRIRVARFATIHRLPAIFDERSYAEDGGLIAYGANFPAMFRRAATYVDKILKGAKPSDLPVE